MVSQAPLSYHEKTHINRSIRKIETAMVESQCTLKKGGKVKAKSQYARNLFYENMLLEEKNYNRELKKSHSNRNNTCAIVSPA